MKNLNYRSRNLPQMAQAIYDSATKGLDRPLSATEWALTVACLRDLAYRPTIRYGKGYGARRSAVV